MKRSEMVLLIAKSLVKPRYPDDLMKEANSILKRLEKAGMKPPGRLDDLLTFSKMDGTKVGEMFASHEWEPENHVSKPRKNR